MNKVWVDTIVPKTKKFIRRKILIIILFGCIIGGGISGFLWMKTNIDQKEEMSEWIVTMQADFVLKHGVYIHKDDYEMIMKSNEMIDEMKQYLGGYEKYDRFKESFFIDESSNKVTMGCGAVSQNEGEKILTKVRILLQNKLTKEKKLQKVNNIRFEKEKDESKKKEKRTITDNLKIFIPISIVVMFVAFIVDFLLKDYISEVYEVHDYFKKQVLAVIPIAEKREKIDYEKD